MFFAVLFFDKIKIDDPVGAISVHGVCGSFGTLSAALFHENLFTGQPFDFWGQLVTQVIGVAIAFAWSFGTCYLLFQAIKHTMGLRVTMEEELGGLDHGEHKANSYPDFAPVSATSGGMYFPAGSSPAMHSPAGKTAPSEV